MIRRLTAGAAAAIVAALTVVCVPAHATTYYEYWGYWHKPAGSGSWQYSNIGPSGYYLPKGSSVEGWRFAVGTAGPSDPKPRPVDVSYDTYCSGQYADKAYRVLLVVDYGTESGAPKGPVYSCYGNDAQPNGYDVLNATHHYVGQDGSGLVCNIDRYPHSGCGQVVSRPAQPTAPRPTPTPTPTPSQHAAPHQSTAASGGTTTTTTTPAATTSARPSTKSITTLTTSPSATVAASTNTSSSPMTQAQPFVPAKTHRSFPWGFVLGGVLVVALGAGAFVARRRAAG